MKINGNKISSISSMKKINFTLSLFLIMLAGLTQAQELSQEKSFNDSLVISTKDTLQKKQFILGLQASGTYLDGSYSTNPSTGIQLGYLGYGTSIVFC